MTRIGERVFRGSKNLAEVSIGSNVSYIGSGAFEASQWYIQLTDEFVIVGDDVLLKYTGKDGDVTVPDRVKVIADAFSGMSRIESVVLGKNVSTIADYAFSGCIKLKRVTVKGKITSIGNCAFIGCTALEELELPETLKSIGDNAFSNCSALSTVTFNGTSDAWYAITVGKGNLHLQSAKMIFTKQSKK